MSVNTEDSEEISTLDYTLDASRTATDEAVHA